MSDWFPIDTAPHEEMVLLYWMDWRGVEHMEVGYASTGMRFSNGYSSVSHHGNAQFWKDLPRPPKLTHNPLTGERLS